MASLNAKYNKLQRVIRKLGSAVIAFSGGLDSSLLAKVAFDCLKDKALAVTAVSETYPHSEFRDAKLIAKSIGIRHLIIKTDEFKNKNFIHNTRDRCYWCKQELFSKLGIIKNRCGFNRIIDGTNFDDRRDIRPGLRANKEFNIISPLYECGLSKKNVRDLAKLLGLAFWNKPSGTCLSSRIPFGEKITKDRLRKVGKAETILHGYLGDNTLIRCRDHKEIVRIELNKENWTNIKKSDINKIAVRLKQLGYKYVTVDLEGYVPAGVRTRSS